VLHESAVPADERLVVDGIPVTSVLRTLLDLASTGDRLAVERGAHAAEARRLGDRLAPLAFLERHRGEPGVAILREVLGDERLGRDVTESPLEEAFLGFLAAHGIRRPEVNAQIGDKRCDAVWRDRRLIVELDSRTWHHTLESFYADRTRDRRLEVAGWHTVRVTARDLREDPEQLAADLRELTSPGRDVR
jgi:very-short-patch-repair endonuclease